MSQIDQDSEEKLSASEISTFSSSSSSDEEDETKINFFRRFGKSILIYFYNN